MGRRAAVLLGMCLAVAGLAAGCTASPAPPVHMARAPECPAGSTRLSAMSNASLSQSSPDDRILPFVPTYALICRYSPPNEATPPSLQAHALVTSRSALRRLREEFDSWLPVPAGTAMSCPAVAATDFFDVYLGSTTRHIRVQLGLASCGFLVGPRSDYWHEGIGDLYSEFGVLTH